MKIARIALTVLITIIKYAGIVIAGVILILFELLKGLCYMQK